LLDHPIACHSVMTGLFLLLSVFVILLFWFLSVEIVVNYPIQPSLPALFQKRLWKDFLLSP
jgi:hypothetical protein